MLPTTDNVRDAVERLPRPYRLLVLGLYYERVPLAEIARQLGVHRHTVERLQDRALVELHERLENWERYEKWDKPLSAVVTDGRLGVDDNMPYIRIRVLPGFGETYMPEFEQVSETTRRVRGATSVLRVFDRTLFHPSAPPVTYARATLLREFAESRLIRTKSGLTPYEQALVQRLKG